MEETLANAPSSMTWRKALQYILYRVEPDGKRPAFRAPLSEDAILVGWSDEPGDPVFVAVDHPERPVTDEEAMTAALNKMEELTGEKTKPDFFIVGGEQFRSKVTRRRFVHDGAVQTRLKL